MNHSTPIWMFWMISFDPKKDRGCWTCGSWGVVWISILGVQKSVFKIIMRSNAKAALGPPSTINPLTKMWRIIFHFTILSCSISEYVKLAKITTIQVLGLVEDQRVFNNMEFIKTKIRNQLVDNLALWSTCLGNQFLQCAIFFMMKLWGFDNQRNVDMPWMLKGFLIVDCLMQSKPCVVLSLCCFVFISYIMILLFLLVCWFFNLLLFMNGEHKFHGLISLFFHEPHWFNDHSLLSSWICFLFVFKIISLPFGVGRVFMIGVQSPP
jgi:hypothetical protein